MCRKRPRPCYQAPPSKRRCVQRVGLPSLPPDVWHTIASMLPPDALGNLAQTATVQNVAAEAARDVLLWRALQLKGCAKGEGTALCRLVQRLDCTPSLRHKNVAAQMQYIAEGGPDALGDGVHFTVQQARAFLGVDEHELRRFAPACVRGVRMRRKSRYALAFAAFPPDVRRDAPVYALRAVLRAARQCHGDFWQVGRVVEVAVRGDEERFERAARAEEVVGKVATECGVPSREVEYALSASDVVTEFRQGRWHGGVERYVKVVRELFAVHVGLGGCYKCLLICDGNARLKAKRIVGKMMRSRREFSTTEMVQALEGNLWWARSKTNVQKMEELSRHMPHIRV